MNFTKNSKSYKIRTFSPISAKLKDQTTQILFAIVKNYFAQNLKFAELGEKITSFQKIKNFIKSEHWRIFSKFNPKRLWTLTSL